MQIGHRKLVTVKNFKFSTLTKGFMLETSALKLKSIYVINPINYTRWHYFIFLFSTLPA